MTIPFVERILVWAKEENQSKEKERVRKKTEITNTQYKFNIRNRNVKRSNVFYLYTV